MLHKCIMANTSAIWQQDQQRDLRTFTKFRTGQSQTLPLSDRQRDLRTFTKFRTGQSHTLPLSDRQRDHRTFTKFRTSQSHTLPLSDRQRDHRTSVVLLRHVHCTTSSGVRNCLNQIWSVSRDSDGEEAFRAAWTTYSARRPSCTEFSFD